MSSYPAPPPPSGPLPPVRTGERVGLGLLAALVSWPVGVVVTVVIFELGFISGISSFVVAFVAVALYVRVAGAQARAGIIPLIGVIVLGIVISYLAVVAAGLVQAYDDLGLDASGQGKVGFVLDNIFRPEILTADTKSLLFFVVFGALGIFSTVRRLLAAR